MTNFDHYTIEDCLNDDSFRAWVYGTDAEAAAFWQTQFDQKHPNHTALETARAFLLEVRGTLPTVSDADVHQDIHSILFKVNVNQSANTEGGQTPPLRAVWRRKSAWRAAAAVAFLVVGAWAIWQTQFKPSQQPITYKNLVREAETALTEVVNPTADARVVYLPDGSSVMLQKQSRLSFPNTFKGNKREVFLSGEAFFEVAKDAKKPFFVYANGLTAKVLGTSFSVRAYDNEADVKIVVKSGKVAVYATDKNNPLSNNTDLTGQILAPKQQATFERIATTIATTQIAQTDLIGIPIEKQNFSFKRKSVIEVLQILEKTYGVRIDYAEETLKTCTLTAELGDEPLAEKLNMICTAIDAIYEQQNDTIFIRSRGCNF